MYSPDPAVGPSPEPQVEEEEEEVFDPAAVRRWQVNSAAPEASPCCLQICQFPGCIVQRSKPVVGKGAVSCELVR